MASNLTLQDFEKLQMGCALHTKWKLSPAIFQLLNVSPPRKVTILAQETQSYQGMGTAYLQVCK